MNKTCLRIGLSLPHTDASGLENILSIPEAFDILELDGELSGQLSNINSQYPWLQDFEYFNFRNLLPASLTRQLCEENIAIIPEYKKQMRELLLRVHALHAETVSIDPDWEILSRDESRRQIFNDILCSTAGDRECCQIELVIPVRIPGSGQVNITDSVKLLYQLSNYRVKLALDIYPHELLNSNLNWADLLRHFRFDISAVRLCYESELGNKLLYKHIEPVIEVLKKFNQTINVYFAPSGRADLNELAEVAQQIKQGTVPNESQ